MLQIVNMGCIPVGFVVAYLVETKGLSITVRFTTASNNQSVSGFSSQNISRI